MRKLKLFRRLQTCKRDGVFAIIVVGAGVGQVFRLQAGDGLPECGSYRFFVRTGFEHSFIILFVSN